MSNNNNLGSTIFKEPFQPKFNFHLFAYSGLGSIAQGGSVIYPADFRQHMGRMGLDKKVNQPRFFRDMRELGLMERKKRVYILKTGSDF